MSRKDATSPARFSVVCGLEDGHRPRRLHHLSGAPPPAGPALAGANNTNRNDRIHDPTQIGTELGGTADGGIDSVWWTRSSMLRWLSLLSSGDQLSTGRCVHHDAVISAIGWVHR